MTKIALSTTFATFAALLVTLTVSSARADEQQRMALNCDLIVSSGRPAPPYCAALKKTAATESAPKPQASPKRTTTAPPAKVATTTVVKQPRPHGQAVELEVSTSATGMTINYGTTATKMRRNTTTDNRLVTFNK